jgi:hypothetical protein
VSGPTWNAAPDSGEGPPQGRRSPNPAHGEGEYQPAEGEVNRTYHPSGGLWQRGCQGGPLAGVPLPGPSASGARGVTRGPATSNGTCFILNSCFAEEPRGRSGLGPGWCGSIPVALGGGAGGDVRGRFGRGGRFPAGGVQRGHAVAVGLARGQGGVGVQREKGSSRWLAGTRCQPRCGWRETGPQPPRRPPPGLEDGARPAYGAGPRQAELRGHAAVPDGSARRCPSTGCTRAGHGGCGSPPGRTCQPATRPLLQPRPLLSTPSLW